jgi:hypothetical protein
LRNPYRDMPSFSYLSDNDMLNIIAFLNTLWIERHTMFDNTYPCIYKNSVRQTERKRGQYNLERIHLFVKSSFIPLCQRGNRCLFHTPLWSEGPCRFQLSREWRLFMKMPVYGQTLIKCWYLTWLWVKLQQLLEIKRFNNFRKIKGSEIFI